MGSAVSQQSKFSAPILPLPRNDSGAAATGYFALVIRPPDAVVLLYSTFEVQSLVERLLKDHVQSSRGYSGRRSAYLHSLAMNDGSHEFRCKSFVSADQKLTFDQQYKMAELFCKLITELKVNGWHLAASGDVSRQEPRRSTLFFRKDRISQELRNIAQRERFLGILAGGTNLVRLIDAPEGLSVKITNEIEKCDSFKDRLNVVEDNACEKTRRFLELHGEYVNEHDKQLLLHKVLLKLFAQLYENGYNFCGTVNFDGCAELMLFRKATVSRAPKQFFSADLCDSNILRTINAPVSLQQFFVTCIDKHWTKAAGVCWHKPHDGYDLYNFNGRPWPTNTTTASLEEEELDALRGRRYLCALFESIRTCGDWRLLTAVQLNRAIGGTSTFIFTDQPEDGAGANSNSATADYRSSVRSTGSARASGSSVTSATAAGNSFPRNAWCTSLVADSKLYLVNGFFLYRGSIVKVHEYLRSIIVARWPRGLGNADISNGFRQFNLNGSPWRISTSSGDKKSERGPNEDLHARALMCLILAAMETSGHQLLCTASVSSKTDTCSAADSQATLCKTEADTWFWVEKEERSRERMSFVSALFRNSYQNNGQQPSAPDLEDENANVDAAPPAYPTLERPPSYYAAASRRSLFNESRFRDTK